MKQRRSIYYSESQKALMWERWKQGWTLHEIGKLFDRAHSSIHRILAETGGIRPTQRSRSSTALTLAEREEISRGLVRGESIRSIAARLARAPSTICREVQRNGGRDGYRASQADEDTWTRAQRPKRCQLRTNLTLARIVAAKLRMFWSPEQISGWLKHTYPCDESHHVSHETIYRSLFIQARGALKKELLAHLRRTRGMRRSRITPKRQQLTVRSSMLFQSVSGLPASKIVRFQAIGKATWYLEVETAKLQRLSSAKRDT